MKCLLVLLFAIAPAWASLETFFVKNLDLEYTLPQGSGVLEKLAVGISKTEPTQNTLPVEIFRRDDAFDVISPYVTFQWLRPYKVIHNLEKISTKSLNLTLGKGEHLLQAQDLKVSPDGEKYFVLKKLAAACAGVASDHDPIERVMKDCREKMDMSIEHLDIPTTFFTDLVELTDEKPVAPEMDLPANDFGLTLNQGDLFAYVQVKFVVRAYIRTWGHLQYEDQGRTLAIRVDKVSFGAIPITNLFLSELRRRVSSERVKIDPPWIRVNLGE